LKLKEVLLKEFALKGLSHLKAHDHRLVDELVNHLGVLGVQARVVKGVEDIPPWKDPTKSLGLIQVLGKNFHFIDIRFGRAFATLYHLSYYVYVSNMYAEDWKVDLDATPKREKRPQGRMVDVVWNGKPTVLADRLNADPELKHLLLQLFQTKQLTNLHVKHPRKGDVFIKIEDANFATNVKKLRFPSYYLIEAVDKIAKYIVVFKGSSASF
jgi:hypothetical protein